MKELFRFICYMCASIIVLSLTFGVVSLVKPQVEFQPSSRVLVTAAHLGELEGYTCIYTDDASDIGVYLREGYVASAPPISSEVTFLNSKGWVRFVSNSEFLIEPIDAELIVHGVSGSTVYYKDKPIGYISGWNGNGLVRCIFY